MGSEKDLLQPSVCCMSDDKTEGLSQLVLREHVLLARRRTGLWGLIVLRLLERVTLSSFSEVTNEPAQLLARSRDLAHAVNAIDSARRWEGYLAMPPALLQVRSNLKTWHEQAVLEMHPARIWRRITGRILDKRLSSSACRDHFADVVSKKSEVKLAPFQAVPMGFDEELRLRFSLPLLQDMSFV